MAELNIKNISIGSLTIALIVSLGFLVQPDDTHFCRSLELAMKCDRLSGTEKTCYPNADDRKGSKYCLEGWEEILQVSGQNVVIIDYNHNLGSEFVCSNHGCIQTR